MHKPSDSESPEKLKETNFPFPEEKVVLLDLDGTCIGLDYGVLDESRFIESIRSIQDVGWQVGISSDTPVDVIRGWSVEFGANGPNIAEKGSVVDIDSQMYYDESKSNLFVKARLDAEEHFKDSGAVVWSGDPVNFIREGRTLGSPGDSVVLVNSYRICSLSIFVRRVSGDGALVADRSLTLSVIDEVRTHYPKIEGLEEDINHDYGLLILSEENVDKRLGTMKLQGIKSLGKVAMIGNSQSDYLGSDIAVHYAVGNADEDFKEKADYVAQHSLSLGVTEVLDMLSLKQ